LLAQGLELRRRLATAAAEPGFDLGWSPSRWSALLEAPGLSVEAVALALASGFGPRRPLLRWWLRWRQLGAGCSAAELMAAGMAPGPALGQRLRQLRAERLDRERR
jgi:poly(A) polymerase